MSQGKSLALAYGIQKKSRRKMAEGGEVKPDAFEEQQARMRQEQMEKENYNKQIDEDSIDTIEAADKHRYAQGGEVKSSIAQAIMHKRKMADDMEMPDGQPYEDLDIEAAKKELYAEDLSDQPLDSNEHGDEIDSDKQDRVSAIRRKMRMKA